MEQHPDRADLERYATAVISTFYDSFASHDDAISAATTAAIAAGADPDLAEDLADTFEIMLADGLVITAETLAQCELGYLIEAAEEAQHERALNRE